MSLTKNEEDYLKALFYLTEESDSQEAGTNRLAEVLGLSPASVNGMLKKLRHKELIAHEKYGKVRMTDAGKKIAIKLVRKHRLWETFLHTHMNFKWEEVHAVAEQLEHVNSPKLISELDRFLGYPKYDPHGAVIPSEDGTYEKIQQITLAELIPGTRCRLVSVKDGSVAFLKYVSKLGLALSSEIYVVEIHDFDGSMEISIDDRVERVSHKFAKNVFVQKM